jgi:hypothetical protein
MCIGVYWVGLEWILTCYGFKPAQSHPIHVDYHQNEQALRWICWLLQSTDQTRKTCHYVTDLQFPSQKQIHPLVRGLCAEH